MGYACCLDDWRNCGRRIGGGVRVSASADCRRRSTGNDRAHKGTSPYVLGPPANQASVGQTEVWSLQFWKWPNRHGGFGGRYSASAISSQRFCTVNVAMTSGKVSGINYTGPSGGLLTAGEHVPPPLSIGGIERKGLHIERRVPATQHRHLGLPGPQRARSAWFRRQTAKGLGCGGRYGRGSYDGGGAGCDVHDDAPTRDV